MSVRSLTGSRGVSSRRCSFTCCAVLRDEHPEDGPIAWWFLRLQHELVEREPSPGGVVRLAEK